MQKLFFQGLGVPSKKVKVLSSLKIFPCLAHHSRSLNLFNFRVCYEDCQQKEILLSPGHGSDDFVEAVHLSACLRFSCLRRSLGVELPHEARQQSKSRHNAAAASEASTACTEENALGSWLRAMSRSFSSLASTVNLRQAPAGSRDVRNFHQ